MLRITASLSPGPSRHLFTTPGLFSVTPADEVPAVTLNCRCVCGG